MVKRSYSVKFKVIIIMVIFLMAVTLIMVSASYAFLSTYTRKSIIQTAELNLSLVAAHIAQDIASVDYVSRWSSSNVMISEWIEKLDKYSANTVFTRLLEEYANTRTKQYISRIIITSLDHERLLHYGSNISESQPVNQYSVLDIEPHDISISFSWDRVLHDPFMPHVALPVIPLFRPIGGPNSGGRIIGWSWMGVSTDIIMDKLHTYPLENDNALYLTLGNDTWLIQGTTLVPQAVSPEDGQPTGDTSLSANTSIRTFPDDAGHTQTIVTYQVGTFPIWISQSLSGVQFARQTELYARQLALFILIILLLGIAVSFFFTRIINRPIAKLQHRLSAISSGDFSTDPTIEWHNELGDVGRGMNELALSVKDLLETTIEGEKKKQELEYRILQSQINPHFLYNTLNSIKWMASLQQAPGIAEMTTALSRLLKNIAKGTRTVIPLKEELELLDDYFTIQRYRYGGSIRLVVTIGKELEQCPIPRFSLQPLVENAIFHGIEPKGGVGTITIAAHAQEDDTVLITVHDDGVGMTREQIDAIFSGREQNEGMFRDFGVANVNSRLRWTFGERFGMSMKSEEGSYTCVTIRIPRAGYSGDTGNTGDTP
ncbi:sensor histidine kinase [Parasphaerochaeta coccoides]|uniref:Integral membrane sensor signal transduction histidine kinase n=1 Tax=Parasphaerochaeta coccoides (strain ATCC BAA-1237 / DSM 17374 / SPN1) TaxID=760011 RepID=F4GLA6_PARC1|nr:sensor histidine kinase [Parasphaerochaeta coccoides]AEC02938.1 integral membrane sensor signal transduction histidine kinase [Parasphaerochaeta coccoides DSM 17374]